MLGRIESKVLSGKRLTKGDAIKLFRTEDIFTLGELAAHVSKKKNGNKAYYVRNLHINPTNLCVNRCKFCAFSRSRGDDDAYELSISEILRKIRKAQPVSELHIVGGLHPDWPFEYYLKMLMSIKKSFPGIHIKAFTATEAEYMSRISNRSIEEVLEMLKDHGLDTMPGGGAEIFSEEVRSRLCPEKLSGQGWLDVMETAHDIGIKTNATMLYGHVEDYEHRVDHLLKLRELQDRTGGFQAFIPLSYHPLNNEAGGQGSSGLDDIKTVAVSRLVLDNFPHIKAYWVMLGEKISQLALLFGADDLDGTVLEENITYSAGAVSRRGITEPELRNLIQKAGRKPVQRDGFYRAVKK